jgi:hypothetical protein
MKIKKEVLNISRMALVMGFVALTCMLGPMSAAGVMDHQAPVLAGMEALNGELSWFYDSTEPTAADSFEGYAALAVSTQVESTILDKGASGEKEDLDGYTE